MTQRIKAITLHDPNHPYEPKDGEQVIEHYVDPNTPEGFIVSSMLFGLHGDDGAILDSELLDRLLEKSRHTQHWNPVTKRPYIRERYKSKWVTYPAKTKRTPAFKNGAPFPWLTRDRNRQFLENDRRAREEIYPVFVDAAARAWIDAHQVASDAKLETFLRARDLMLVIAEAAGVKSEAVAMADLREAVRLIREAQRPA
jgi:hypothetical protein